MGGSREPAALAGAVASRLRRLARRPPVRDWDRAAVRFRGRVIGLVLLVALRHVGVPEEEVGWVEALAAFAFVRLLLALPFTPGGLGVFEVAMAASLAAAGERRP